MRDWRELAPNILSASRIPAAAVFVLVYSPATSRTYWIGVGCLAFALITDFLDGRIARAWGVCSNFGCFLDGLCDKTVYSAILIVIAREAPEMAPLCWFLILREILLYAVRSLDRINLQTHLKFRSTSLLYAFLIRSFFVGFFLWNRIYSEGEGGGAADYYYILGLFSGFIGGFHLYLTVVSMHKQS
jgi:phosphatidylglycerophosphate synthase